MPAEGILHRKADFAQRAALPRAVHGQRQQIALAFRAVAQRIQRGLRLRLVPRRLDPVDARDLRLADLGVVDIENLDLVLVLQPVFRSEEQTSELQSLMRLSYAVFCLKKHKTHK